MNSLMSSAPAPTAAVEGPSAPMPNSPSAGMMQGPQGPPMGGPMPPPVPPAPEQLKTARTHIGAVISGLRSLVDRPRGDLTKKDVFEAAAEMIAKGAFPTPESKQALVVQLAQMPDDEPDIRQMLGGMLLQTSHVQSAIHSMHGPG